MKAFSAGLALFLAAVVSLAGAMAGSAATAKMTGPDGKPMGRANFRSTAHGVLIEIEVKNLPPGPHAVLLHAKGNCDSADGFAAAGPVWSLDASRTHGYFAKRGPATGDLPLQFAGSDGVLHASFYTTLFTLGGGTKSAFDGDGTSIVVHADSDDYHSQPEGRAGARLACGALVRTAGTIRRKTHH